ncbi:hypothetical protein Patl1_32818 [Pistacia atlantica]|uniref:Uncharacterized protein n=1 Tax=Pistacia atlantica TaxID=434234 RepID=A0ACC1ANY3_9ROSI|nr:hypothetical protein Patl1_32818 [Pistacia atlantica]
MPHRTRPYDGSFGVHGTQCRFGLNYFYRLRFRLLPPLLGKTGMFCFILFYLFIFGFAYLGLSV